MRVNTNDPGIIEEIAHWKSKFEEHSHLPIQEITDRLSGPRPLDESLELLLAKTCNIGETAELLDVGCGPISALGKKGKQHELNITGLDPLAKLYTQLLDQYNVQLPYRLIEGFGETLSSDLGHAKYDLIYSRNALDHSSHAPTCILEIMKSLKPNAYAKIWVVENEAENAAYSGLHQWNFSALNNQVIIWNPVECHSLDHLIDGRPFRFNKHNHIRSRRKFPHELEITIFNFDYSRKHCKKVHDYYNACYSAQGNWVAIENISDHKPLFHAEAVRLKAEGLLL